MLNISDNIHPKIILNIDNIQLDWLHLRRIDYRQSLTKEPKAWTEYISNLTTKT